MIDIDLGCLVADRNMEAAVTGILGRPEALGIPEIRFEVIVHPGRDPGCFHRCEDLLRGFRNRAEHALVLLDLAWDGVPAKTGEDLEGMLEDSLARSGLAGWASPVVIDPELEAWVFSDSPHVVDTIWRGGGRDAMRRRLEEVGLWGEGDPKPRDPKAAVDLLLREVRRPRSSSLYNDLARKVSLARCGDRAFGRLKELLAAWFGR